MNKYLLIALGAAVLAAVGWLVYNLTLPSIDETINVAELPVAPEAETDSVKVVAKPEARVRIGHEYEKDSQNVYFIENETAARVDGTIASAKRVHVQGADPKTFNVYEGQGGSYFARDLKNVYYQKHSLNGWLEIPYTLDGAKLVAKVTDVRTEVLVVPGADPATFVIDRVVNIDNTEPGKDVVYAHDADTTFELTVDWWACMGDVSGCTGSSSLVAKPK